MAQAGSYSSDQTPSLGTSTCRGYSPRKTKRPKKKKKKKERKEKEEISTNTKEIEKAVREYCEQLYANKSDNLEEMDNFLETQSPPKLNQEKTDNMNRSITRSEIEYVIKKKKKTPTKVYNQMASQVN